MAAAHLLHLLRQLAVLIQALHFLAQSQQSVAGEVEIRLTLEATHLYRAALVVVEPIAPHALAHRAQPGKATQAVMILMTLLRMELVVVAVRVQ